MRYPRTVLAVGAVAFLAHGLPLLAQSGIAGLSAAATVICSSQSGGREHCPADTSGGIALVRATGTVTCLLGRNWGYDDSGVWVAEGCGGEFVLGQSTRTPPPPAAATPPPAAALPPAAAPPAPPVEEAPEAPEAKPGPDYVGNLGFKLLENDKGQIYMRLFSYARYLNQKDLDPTYTNYFGDVQTVKQREDVQLTKFFLPFAGWFLTPQLRYYLYVWSSNTSQGDAAQVVGGGNLTWIFNEYAALGVGITSLPSTRSTEGQFPYWLGVDDRIISDEFFRGSYTTGIWLKGAITDGLNYQAMVGNNLSTLGVSASQLDNKLDTFTLMMNWLPTTKEFGPIGAFGDYEGHEDLATRLGAHWTTSTEDKQSQAGPDSIENSQIRLTDGSIIFARELFGPGINVDKVKYEMTSLDAGVKWQGFSLDFEYYWRHLSDFEGTHVEGIADISDHGYQLQASAMLVPRKFQIYAATGEINGIYGDGSEVRAGMNYFLRDMRGWRINAEWINLEDCPVGYTAVPYPVGGNGSIYTAVLEMNF
jgi:hypothetical protein